MSSALKFTLGFGRHPDLVWSGVGETIEKEEWRGEIVGNLFYPKNEKPRGLVLHMNGSAMMLQDARKVSNVSRTIRFRAEIQQYA